MDLKQLFTDDDAVSPVIGVILMVAITVILAAVIAALVLGLGDEPQDNPQAQFEFDWDGSDLTIEHNGGDDITSDELEVRGEETSGTSYSETWTSLNGGTTIDVGTGETVTVSAASSDYDLSVVYVPSGGGESAPLASDEGPDA